MFIFPDSNEEALYFDASSSGCSFYIDLIAGPAYAVQAAHFATLVRWDRLKEFS